MLAASEADFASMEKLFAKARLIEPIVRAAVFLLCDETRPGMIRLRVERNAVS